MTKKEIIAELIAQGLTNKEIADKTGINYNTVYSHARDLREPAAVGGGWSECRQTPVSQM